MDKMNTIEKTILDFVTKRCMDEQEKRISCLVMALENARILSGRTKCSGKSRKANDGTVIADYLESKFFEENILVSGYSFAGLIHYLLLLDLIGNVLKPKDKSSEEKNSIYKALEYFSPITDVNNRCAIVSLRNCLAHNYGLINIPELKKLKNAERIKERKERYQHKFTLHLNDNAKNMIQIPKPESRWNGNYAMKDESLSTKINVCELIDVIEETYQKVKDMAVKKELELCFKGGIDELKSRFTVKFE